MGRFLSRQTFQQHAERKKVFKSQTSEHTEKLPASGDMLQRLLIPEGHHFRPSNRGWEGLNETPESFMDAVANDDESIAHAVWMWWQVWGGLVQRGLGRTNDTLIRHWFPEESEAWDAYNRLLRKGQVYGDLADFIKRVFSTDTNWGESMEALLLNMAKNLDDYNENIIAAYRNCTDARKNNTFFVPGPGTMRWFPNAIEEMMLSKSDEKSSAPKDETALFPDLAGAKWPDVGLIFRSPDVLEFVCRDRRVRRNYLQLGMEDGRANGKPNSLWHGLMEASRKGTGFLVETPEARSTKTQATKLRKILQSLFPQIEGDPLPYDHKNNQYRVAFSLSQNMF